MDDFLDEKTIWVATLEDGTMVFQDDGRPGVSEPNAWVRLGEYVAISKNRIRRIGLRFRSHVIELPKLTAYYFTSGVTSVAGTGVTTLSANLGGMYGDGKIHVTWYRCPEIIPIKEIVKDMSDIKGPELIPSCHAEAEV
jgi:hypothetical protein